MYRNSRWFQILLLFLVFVFFHPLQYAFAGPPEATQSALTATTPGSDTAPANGTSTTSMTLTLKDALGAALAGDTVSLSLSSDPAAVVNPTSAVLDSNGQAVFTIFSTTVGLESIDVTDSTQSTTLTALGSVTFSTVVASNVDHNASATPACTQQAPMNAPNLYQVSINKTMATLFWAPPNDTFDSYTISYGKTSSADNYSVNYALGATTGAVSYQINSLTAKMPYSFKVRANNGCAAGPWSGVKGTNVQLSNLPATGPSPVLMSVGLTGAALFLAGMFFLIF